MGIIDFVWIRSELPVKCYIWGIALYGGEIFSFRKVH